MTLGGQIPMVVPNRRGIRITKVHKIGTSSMSEPILQQQFTTFLYAFRYRNIKMFLVTSQQSRDDAKEIGAALGLSDKTVETINSYPLPELMDPKERFSAFTYVANDKIRRLVGTVKNVASRELLYAASSDNETFDSRAKSLGSYQNVVTGIIQESEKLLCASEESATESIL